MFLFESAQFRARNSRLARATVREAFFAMRKHRETPRDGWETPQEAKWRHEQTGLWLAGHGSPAEHAAKLQECALRALARTERLLDDTENALNELLPSPRSWSVFTELSNRKASVAQLRRALLAERPTPGKRIDAAWHTPSGLAVREDDWSWWSRDDQHCQRVQNALEGAVKITAWAKQAPSRLDDRLNHRSEWSSYEHDERKLVLDEVAAQEADFADLAP